VTENRKLLQSQRKMQWILWIGTAAVIVAVLMGLQLYRQPRLVVYANSNLHESLKVLFVGNSLTYYHDMPAIMIGLIQQEQPDRPLKVAMVTGPGASLHDHYHSGKLKEVLQEHGPWDWVVLQEKGGLPLAQPEKVQHDTLLLAKQVRESGARPILYVDWMNPPISEGNEYGYHAIARQLRIDVVPISDIWHVMRKELPDCELLCADGIHPNFVGSYVVAYVCASTFLGKAPENLPADFVYQMPIDHKIEIGTTASAEVSWPFRTTLQAEASAILRDLTAVRSE
jgi:hypothetical protein